MISESEVQEKLASLLSDDLSLKDFEDWIVAHSYNMHLDSTAEAEDLVELVYLPLMEYSSGDLAYNDLRKELSALLSTALGNMNVEAHVGPAPVLVKRTGQGRSASRTSRSRYSYGAFSQLATPLTSFSGTLVMA